MEASLGVAFLLIAYANPDPILAVLLAALVTILAIGAAYDLEHLIIPDEVVVGACGAGIMILGYHVVLGAPLSATVIDAVGGAMIGFLFFGALWRLSHGKWMGFGDAKLAIPLGMLTGITGGFSMIVLSFWVGAVVSLGYMAVVRVWGGQSALRFHGTPITMKSEVPFAPYLLIAFVLVYFFHLDVLALTSYVSQLFI
jgi:prepilin signal peptidase PulO-like enzyme (type II secretory pathway)